MISANVRCIRILSILFNALPRVLKRPKLPVKGGGAGGGVKACGPQIPWGSSAREYRL